MIAIMSLRFLDMLAALPGRDRALAAGAQLFAQGQPVTELHVVREGEVLLLRHGADGAQAVLQRAGPGDLLAEASIFAKCYHCSAEAASSVRLSAWPLRAVRRLLEERPEASLALARHLAAEVRRARARAERLAMRRLEDRLAAWLTAAPEGLPPKGQWHLLARELGASPEALYRTLARRRRAGVARP